MTSDSGHKASILIVDDTVDNLQLMASMLKERGYEPRPVPNGKLALQAAHNDPPDLILLDISMPGMTGYEVCERLKAHANTKDIPVIFISALDETMDKVKAFKVGGSDYVTKPLEYEEVFARLECQLALRRARLDLEKSYASLRELEKLRDNLVHMIVHDMRSPLSVLLANGFFLKQSLADRLSAEDASDIDALLAAGERLRSMAEDLLAVSRLEAGRMPLALSACDLSEVVRLATDSMKRLEADRPVVIDAPKLAPIVCDEKLVFRVVENLVSNGMKHTPPGLPLNVSVIDDAAGVRVVVRDEGPGVPDELKDKIFEKFGTLKGDSGQRYRSVGLGLALCKLAVEAHGGRIGVNNELPQGSAFWFTLPRAAESQ